MSTFHIVIFVAFAFQNYSNSKLMIQLRPNCLFKHTESNIDNLINEILFVFRF